LMLSVLIVTRKEDFGRLSGLNRISPSGAARYPETLKPKLWIVKCTLDSLATGRSCPKDTWVKNRKTARPIIRDVFLLENLTVIMIISFLIAAPIDFYRSE